VLVNERVTLAPGTGLSLGVFTLTTMPTVEVRTDAINGYVAVDAMQFIAR
jgi:hypothetical protein